MDASRKLAVALALKEYRELISKFVVHHQNMEEDDSKRRIYMEEGDRDTGSCCTNTSRWSSPCCGSDGPEYPSDHEERADRTPDEQPSVKLQGSKQSGYIKAQGVQKQKIKSEILKLPPIRPPQSSKPWNQSANTNCIWVLKSQVWDLQQQLGEAKAENKLLKKAQHRHMVAQQHFREPGDSIHQILAKHDNETKALQSLLRETRVCRDNLARQLQAAERKLLSTKDALHHLQQLSQDQSLLEREALTLRLARATTQLEEKDRRLQNMERSLELHRESFKRQIDSEQRKIRGARNTSTCLQEHIHQLTRELQHHYKCKSLTQSPEKNICENTALEDDHQEDESYRGVKEKSLRKAIWKKTKRRAQYRAKTTRL